MQKSVKKISLLAVLAAICLAAFVGSLWMPARAEETEPTYIDFSTKMMGQKWTFETFGSSPSLASARTKGTVADGKLVIAKDSGVNWTMSSAVLRYNGEKVKYNDVEYRFNVKFDGTVSGLGGQIALLATGDATKWGNNAEYGSGVYLQYWDGNSIQAYYRNGSEENGDGGTRIGTVQMYNDEFLNSEIEIRADFSVEETGTRVNVFANGNQLVSNYLAEGLKTPGQFGIVSGNSDADIVLTPYAGYGESGLEGQGSDAWQNAETGISQVNLQEYIDAGYATQYYNDKADNASGLDDAGKYVVDSASGNDTNVAQIRFGTHHYSTAALDVVYNFKLQIFDKTTGSNDFTVAMFNFETGAKGYALKFHSDGVVKLMKIETDYDTVTDLTEDWVSLPENFFNGGVVDMSFGRETLSDGVRVFFYMNGTKLIDVKTTGDDASSNASSLVFRTQYGSYKMGIAGYTTAAPYTDDGDPAPYGPGDVVAKDDLIVAENVVNLVPSYNQAVDGAYVKKDVSAAVSGADDEQVLTVTTTDGAKASGSGQFNYAGVGARSFVDLSLSFRMKLTYNDPAEGKSNGWGVVIPVRFDNIGSGPWAGGSGYNFTFFDNAIVLMRMTSDNQEEITRFSTSPADGTFHSYLFTVVNEGESVRILGYMNDVLMFNYLDETAPSTTAGYFGMLIATDWSTTTLGVKNVQFMAGEQENAIAPDTEAPVITVPNKPTEGKVGEEISLPVGSFSDNVTDPSQLIIKRTVKGPDGKDVTVTNRKFVPASAGTYVVTYTAEDEAGKVGTFTWNIVVVAADGQGGGEEEKTGCGAINLNGFTGGTGAVLLLAGAIFLLGRSKKKI